MDDFIYYCIIPLYDLCDAPFAYPTLLLHIQHALLHIHAPFINEMHRLKSITAAEVQIKVATAPSTIASGVANTPPKAVVSP